MATSLNAIRSLIERTLGDKKYADTEHLAKVLYVAAKEYDIGMDNLEDYMKDTEVPDTGNHICYVICWQIHQVAKQRKKGMA